MISVMMSISHRLIEFLAKNTRFTQVQNVSKSINLYYMKYIKYRHLREYTKKEHHLKDHNINCKMTSKRFTICTN